MNSTVDSRPVEPGRPGSRVCGFHMPKRRRNRPPKNKARGRAIRAAIAAAGTGAPTMTAQQLRWFRKHFVVLVATLRSTDAARPRWIIEAEELVKLEAACPLFTSSATMQPLLVLTPANAVLLVLYNERSPSLSGRKEQADERFGPMPKSSTLVPALRALPNQITPAGSHYAGNKSIAVGAGYHAIQSFYRGEEFFKCAYAPYPCADDDEAHHRHTVLHAARMWEDRTDVFTNNFLKQIVSAYRVRARVPSRCARNSPAHSSRALTARNTQPTIPPHPPPSRTCAYRSDPEAPRRHDR